MNKVIGTLNLAVIASFNVVFSMEHRVNGEKPGSRIINRLNFEDRQLQDCDRIYGEIRTKLERAKTKERDKNMRYYKGETVAYTQDELDRIARGY